MKKQYFVLILSFISLLSLAQDYSALWQGHFSYYNVKEVVNGHNKIYAVADNAIFSLDVQTNEIEEFNTINGLSGETISTTYYSEDYGLLVIGYETGLIEIVFNNGDEVLSVVDIIEKATIPPTDKRINHFSPYQNLIYISTNYGISVFDLERLEFGDTYFIGNNGSQIQVNQTAIFNDFIYAACSGGNGIKRAQASNPNLIDFQNWQTVFTGNYLFIEEQEQRLYAINTSRRIYDITNDILNELFIYSDTPLYIKSVDQHLTVTTKNNVYVYDENFSLLSQINTGINFETEYTSAIEYSNNVYIGTKDFGVLKTTIDNPIEFEEIHPKGPLMNIPFSIEAEPGGVWVTFGEYTATLNPYPLNSRGISHLKENYWLNTRYSDINFDARCLNTININPFNTSQVFISSFIDGLLLINDDVPTDLFNESNSTLEDLVLPNNPGYVGDIRVGGADFDESGVLWMLVSRIDNPLKSFNTNTNQWNSFSFTDIIQDGLNDELGYKKLFVGNDNTKWVASHNHGIIGFNENNTPKIKHIQSEDENMPSNDVRAVALDKRNQLWIGTARGLRVLYNTSSFFEDDNIQVEEIIIEEDGIAKELLFQQLITDIEVDGSNNKWIGTADSGLFYFSSDGQNTIHHFTRSNSPLPSNTINDISLDETKGIVFIATSRGLVSYRSGGSSPTEDLASAFAYPNPVRPNFNIVDEKVKIKDISQNVNIKITDIEGNLVAEAQSRVNQRYRGYNLEIDGGTAYWNGKNLANNIVASGVYLVMLSDLDTFETKVIKLMVVR
ncbi:type IX secretion system anionic LPS delivery protein PorZ [Seonamhaeicola aphaedonensis]|uniref:Two component regulator with propeller domain n=1 Tax=Seonamhaeicola aphaedonensis TaxID=1461338 RepID=A0A3D9HHQ5_9FLAO|nr:two-component regulator propeller domain-containing protein [Seonamhaeicola aphaedonensis]RED48781.1 two component regulator with propeller domain [Seonamhaeicola aphaedonensis]